MKVKVPVQDAWASRVSPLPPPPSFVGGVAGGGGGRVGGPVPAWGFWVGKGGSLASKSRELTWRLFLASKFSGLKSHINPASCHCRFSWRVISAHLFGGFSWRVNQAVRQATQPGGIGSLESILGLLKSFKIWALGRLLLTEAELPSDRQIDRWTDS